MLFVSVSCLLFGINLYCNSGWPCPPDKGHTFFPWEKMCPHITEKCWGREICADVAVARPWRCRTSHVQIVSHQQKGPSSSHVAAAAAADAVVTSVPWGWADAEPLQRGIPQSMRASSPGPVHPHHATLPHPTPASKKVMQRLPCAACLGRMVQACPIRVQELKGFGDI